MNSFDSNDIVWNSTPAVDWQDASPCGNGRIGALVFGNIAKETILLNHEKLFFGEVDAELPDISYLLPKVRELLLKGDHKQANCLYVDELTRLGVNSSPGNYIPAFCLNIEMETDGIYQNYQRSVDMSTAEVTIQWECAYQEIFCRKTFVSRSNDTVVTKIYSPTGAKLNVILSLDVPAFPQLNSDLVNSLKFTRIAHEETLEIECRNVRGILFSGAAKIYVRGGTVECKDAKINVCSADEVLVLAVLALGENKARASAQLYDQLPLQGLDYSDLLSRHVILHQKLYGSSFLKLETETTGNPNESLLLEANLKSKAPIELIQKMYNFGRYLHVCSSGKGCLPPNLQGIWNGNYVPAWWSGYILNENVQMSFFQSLTGNMPEMLESLFDFIESKFKDFARNARHLWACRGIFIPTVVDFSNGKIVNIQPHTINWTGAAGWIAQYYYDYWLFTRDDKFLSDRAVPFMKEVASFYMDFVTYDVNGRAVFSPSISPENAPRSTFNAEQLKVNSHEMNPGIPTSVNATMDIAIAKELLTNLIKACDYLEIDRDMIPVWTGLLTSIPSYQINEDGALKEWCSDNLGDNYYHRHVSHLYPLFPGYEFHSNSQSSFRVAAEIALEKRMECGFSDQTGWSLVHIAGAYARLGKAEKVDECLNILIRTCVGQNLFTYHNDWRKMGVTIDYKWCDGKVPFQIDANMGFSAVLLESLVFSTNDSIKLLPALPTGFVNGKLHNVLTRAGAVLSLEWDMSKDILEFSILPLICGEIIVKLPSCGAKPVKVSDESFLLKGDMLKIRMQQDVPCSFSFEVDLKKHISGQHNVIDRNGCDDKELEKSFVSDFNLNRK